MAKVTNLTIALQSNSDNTYFATWEFNKKTTTTTTSGVKKGSLVSIKSGATYYNGAHIPEWVKNEKWYIASVSGDRAVLGQNESKTNNITSPINTKYLSGTSSTTTTTTTDIDNLDHYTVKWYYDTGDDVWFTGSSSDEKSKQATYSPPSNAIRIKVTVKPVSKKYKKNGKETSYWTGESVSKTYSKKANPPAKPGTPTVEVEKLKLTATVTLDPSEYENPEKADQIEFQIERRTGENTIKVFGGAHVAVKSLQASYSCTITVGGEYRVHCRAVNIYGTSKIYSDWSSFTSWTSTVPSAPSKISSCKATSETSVYLKWSSVSTADSYEIEYTNKSKYFDISDQTTIVQTNEENKTNQRVIAGLESGQEYFFRVRAKNENGVSDWTAIKSVILGKVPVAPTTWSSTTKAIVGEDVTLYWVHNSADSSTQTKAEIELTIGGVKTTETVTTSTPEGEEEKTYFKVLKTNSYTEGTKIEWRVKTAGVTGQYGEYSINRTVDVHAKPSQSISITDIRENSATSLTTFPFRIEVTTAPDTQTPIGYHIAITAEESYQTVDNLGNDKIVRAGEAVYSKYYDVKTDLLLELSAESVNLEDSIDYRVTSVVSMDSGLTDTTFTFFRVHWDEIGYEPDAEIAIDKDTLEANITPYCTDDDGNLIEDVTLSVYRREFDGSFTEIATGLNNSLFTTVIDPHPSLDFARYRIIASTKSTGAIRYYDTPGEPVGGTCVIIQWNEEWSEFNTDSGDSMAMAPKLGSTLRLPYNIKVSDKTSQDVALVNYIGRENPVSYYGTQIGHSSTWNVDIDRDDTDALYALRRLARWMGDVYVREPSGTGYWATIKVSYNSSYDSLVIPVTLDITRVEGGV